VDSQAIISYAPRPTPATLIWQLDFPVTEFRKWRSDSNERLPNGLQLRGVVIYTIGTDIGLEIEQIEVLHE